jgi:hypothetical protein
MTIRYYDNPLQKSDCVRASGEKACAAFGASANLLGTGHAA